ncbi:hypothetical protein QBC43DRAFT_210237, partial [Cladorrhinum sp. PSN259]
RLLHTSTLKFESFVNHTQAPPYTILSHTWDDDEITFQDLIGDRRTCQGRKGWRKTIKACRYASAYGWSYIWIDTCCIDKTNSPELCEALNSSYYWYEAADVCYADLSDVPPLSSTKSRFKCSRWFTRGWSIQVLLAPTFLEFIDKGWAPIGIREEWATVVHLATRIALKDLANFRECSVATKLSWAANRQTAHLEDRAYSLLGLLGVTMPPIYGEGEYAFARLQLEVIKRCDDESIFACRESLHKKKSSSDDPSEIAMQRGLQTSRTSPILAQCPTCFRDSRGLVIHRFDTHRRGFTMTNAGLDMSAELFQLGGGQGSNPLYLIRLNSCLDERGENSYNTTGPNPLVLLL